MVEVGLKKISLLWSAAIASVLLQLLVLAFVWPRLGAHTAVNFYGLALPFALVVSAALMNLGHPLAPPSLISGVIGMFTPIFLEHTGLQWCYGNWLAAGLPEDPPNRAALGGWCAILAVQIVWLVIAARRATRMA